MSERIQAAADAYRETLTELRLREGGGFKVASQNRRALEDALAAAEDVMFRTLEELAASWDDEWNNCEPGDQAAFGKGLAADELRSVIAALRAGLPAPDTIIGGKQ